MFAVTSVEMLLERYLCDERGLSASSMHCYADVARKFLSRLFTEAELDLERLTTAEVTAHVLSECRRRTIGSAKSMTTRLRSLGLDPGLPPAG